MYNNVMFYINDNIIFIFAFRIDSEEQPDMFFVNLLQGNARIDWKIWPLKK